MKKLILSIAVMISLSAFAADRPSEVSEKVLKAFNETFTKATDVVWHEYDNYYQANFNQDEIQIRAQYDEEGSLIRTIRYYNEKQLLPNIVSKLKKKYNTQEIFGVTETSSSNEVSFVVTLKDKNNWYVVTSDIYGNLDQTKKFKRADL
jgi:hypothetical protein